MENSEESQETVAPPTPVEKLAALGVNTTAPINQRENWQTNGVEAIVKGLPYHIHPTATPELWEALQEVLADEDNPLNIVEYTPPPPPPEPTLDEAKAWRGAALNREYEAALATVTAGYPQSEQASWIKQETEARAYAADNNATTPYLSTLAAARGITVATLAPLVIANADAFALASATLTGRRQAARDAINAAETKEAVAAVEWDFAL